MTTVADLGKVFTFRAETVRIGAIGINAATVGGDNQATAVALTAQLLRLSDLKPSGNTLSLQIRPEDAMKLAASILDQALEKRWPIDSHLFTSIQRVYNGRSTKFHNQNI